MARKYTIIVEQDEDDWLVSEVVGLPGYHTQAKDMNQLIERTKEAIKAYLEDEDFESSEEFIGVQQIEVQFLKLPKPTGKELGKIAEKF